jgi:hypothetical protein
MDKEERKEFDEMLCGSSCFQKGCYMKRGDADKLVYSDGIYRCHTRAYCSRVTPVRGKITRWMGRYDKIDDFKIALINRKLKAMKNELKVPTMKLVIQNKRAWVEMEDGKKVSPRHFSSRWWQFKFEREERA